MKEKISVQEVMMTLSMAKSVLDEKGLTDFTSNLIILDGKVYAGNDKMIIISPIKINLNFAVNGIDFHRVLDGLEGEVTLEVIDNQIKISSKKMKAILAMWEPEKAMTWISHSGLDGEFNWKELPKDFWTALEWCKFSISKDVSARALTCIQLKDKKVVSTDNFRISMYELDEAISKESILIPKENLSSILKFPEMTEYALVKTNDDEDAMFSWMVFRSPSFGLICGTRLVVGELPDVEPFFIEEGEEIKLPSSLQSQVAKASKFSEGMSSETTSIIVTLENNKVITVANKSTGSLEQESEIDYDGKSLSFQTSPALFEQILAKTETMQLRKSTLKFKVDKFQHVLSIKTNDEMEEETEETE